MKPAIVELTIAITPTDWEVEIRDRSLENAPGNGTRVRKTGRSFRQSVDPVLKAQELSEILGKTAALFLAASRAATPPAGQ